MKIPGMSGQRDSSSGAAVVIHTDCYCIDDLIVEIDRQRVSRQGCEIRLGRMTFELFAILIKGAPEVVSAAVLMNQLWPDAEVDRDTLTQRIIGLRAALGDDARTPRYIASVRGRGYRIVAQVQSFVRPDLNSGPVRLRAVLRAR
jgi:DNA-binding winged helix-turn-helix (wHTH) protein